MFYISISSIGVTVNLENIIIFYIEIDVCGYVRVFIIGDLTQLDGLIYNQTSVISYFRKQKYYQEFLCKVSVLQESAT